MSKAVRHLPAWSASFRRSSIKPTPLLPTEWSIVNHILHSQPHTDTQKCSHCTGLENCYMPNWWNNFSWFRKVFHLCKGEQDRFESETTYTPQNFVRCELSLRTRYKFCLHRWKPNNPSTEKDLKSMSGCYISSPRAITVMLPGLSVPLRWA